MIQVLRAVLLLAAIAAGAGSATAEQAGQPTPQQPAPSTPPAGGQAPAPGAPAAGQAPAPPSPAGQAPPAPTTPPQTPVAPGAPTTPVTPAAASTAATPPPCPAPVPPATAPSRAFTASTGLLLHQVQSTRVLDFERLLAYVRDALAKTTNVTLRNQARGWEFYRVAEPGPNGDVLYAFLLDPAVPCADYALGPILSDVYRDPAQLQEIWKLYTGSVRNGGTIMNLVAVPPMPAPPIVTPPTTPPGAAPAPLGQTPATPQPGTVAPGPPSPGTPGAQTPGAGASETQPPAGQTPTAPGQAPQVPLDANPVRRP